MAMTKPKSSQIEHRGESVQKKLDDAVYSEQLTSPTGDDAIGGFDSYAKLGGYTGSASVSRFVDLAPRRHKYISGEIYRIEEDLPPDGGYVFKDGLGRTWVRKFDGTILADYFVQDAEDAAPGIRAAIECVKNLGGGTVEYTEGRVYSLRSLQNIYYHGEILQLYSNIRHYSKGKATLKVDVVFDDRVFVVFNGFDTPDPDSSSVLYNIGFEGLIFDFSGDVSRMRTAYRRRVGIQTGHVVGGYIRNCVFVNGDIQNAVIAGWGTGRSKDFKVHDCDFENLVQESPANIDFTAAYMCCTGSKVYDCNFIETSLRAGEIACPVELHASKSKFVDCHVEAYSKCCFLVSTLTENQIVTDLLVDGITGWVTNSLAQPWCDEGCILARVIVQNCDVRSQQREGVHIDVHGYRGILVIYDDSSGAGTFRDFTVKGNRWRIDSSANIGTANAIYIRATVHSLSIVNNEFVECTNGVLISTAQGKEFGEGLNIVGNDFRGATPTVMVRVVGDEISRMNISENVGRFFGTYDSPIQVDSMNVVQARVWGNYFPSTSPTTRDVAFTDGLTAHPSNRVSYRLYGVSLNIPALATGGVGAAGAAIPVVDLRPAGVYTLDQFIVPSAVRIAPVAKVSGGSLMFDVTNIVTYDTGTDTVFGALVVEW